MPKAEAKLTTAIGAVVDESYSMNGRAEETRGSFNKYFDNIEKEDPTAVVTVATFSDSVGRDKVRFITENTKVTDMPYLDEENYSPDGNTPLLDAVGQTIKALSRTKADRYLVVILTDGFENASKEYSREDIRKLISEKEASDKWTFVFMGAGVDAWSGAQYIGISTPGTTFAYTGTPGTTKTALRNVTASTSNYLGSTKTSSPDFFDEKKKEKTSS